MRTNRAGFNLTFDALKLSFILCLLLCARINICAAQDAKSSQTQWHGAPGQRFFSSVGQRGFLSAIGSEGIEGYVYPFLAFHDLRASFQTEGSTTWLEGRALLQSVDVSPSTIVRTYAAPGLRVRETIFAPIEQAALLVLYEAETEKPVRIAVSFQPDMDLMWPAGIGGQAYSWDEAHHAFVIEEPSGQYRELIGSPAALVHSDPMDRSEPWKLDRKLSLELQAIPHTVVPVVVSLQIPKVYDADAIYTQALAQYSAWKQAADSHYAAMISERLQITVGDAETDQALAWATIALAQMEACNPDLGCGLVAGYGPTWPMRRPQYAWFFGGDGLLTAAALESTGAHETVEQELAFLRKYQNATTGGMWHEISQSAAHLDWFHAYPFIYRHTDISPQYLATIREIWRQSKDKKLLETSWPSLEAAWRYCLAHVDPKDGLLEIPAGESGVNENSADKVDKELPTEMTWIEGAAAFSELAEALGKPELAESARAAAQRAKSALTKFWDPARQYYNEGIFADGKPFTQEMASPVFGVAEGLFPAEQSSAVFQKLSEAAFLAPWGLRSIPSTAANYQPESYQHGSVWPISTASYVLAALALHRPEQAWPIWKSLVEDSYLDSPGHMPEVLSGAAYRLLDVAVPQQAFSTAALLNATLRGILGLEPNAPANKVRFAPHLLPQWTQVSIISYPFGGHKLSFTVRRMGDEVYLSVKNDGSPFELEFAPMLDIAGKVTAVVNGKTLAAEVRDYGSDKHAVVKFRVEGEASLRLKQAPR